MKRRKRKKDRKGRENLYWCDAPHMDGTAELLHLSQLPSPGMTLSQQTWFRFAGESWNKKGLPPKGMGETDWPYLNTFQTLGCWSEGEFSNQYEATKQWKDFPPCLLFLLGYGGVIRLWKFSASLSPLEFGNAYLIVVMIILGSIN